MTAAKTDPRQFASAEAQFPARTLSGLSNSFVNALREARERPAPPCRRWRAASTARPTGTGTSEDLPRVPASPSSVNGEEEASMSVVPYEETGLAAVTPILIPSFEVPPALPRIWFPTSIAFGAPLR